MHVCMKGGTRALSEVLNIDIDLHHVFILKPDLQFVGDAVVVCSRELDSRPEQC